MLPKFPAPQAILVLKSDMTTDELVHFMVENGRRWVAAQREAFQPTSDPISEEDRAVLRHYFGHGVLQGSRVCWVDEIANPDFYQEVERAGLPMPLDFRLMTAITFVDTIVVSRSQFEGPATWRPLLFHELVHAVQYRVLGLARFVAEYVEGWARNGFFYESIPLERMAYELQGRFDLASSRFSAESEVVRALGATA
ncbi:MAG: hypothetical protein ACM3SU_17750 [Acidobacteriota bacterium]